ncbi:MAG: hypothetical protein UV38_C0003G0011 [candidate division TM6 bacterium GW2011_GWE2_42_60]|nr:MAG: hypothetical protein UV38_C0003G0011 [candidate division TM6 bacterium GW2011_GWE2_42_60]HBY05932.1 hypothetical protein [Candidatus Dependentiae bacterium]
MKKFLLSALFVGSFCVSALLMSSQNYAINVRSLQDAADEIATLSQDTIETASFNLSMKKLVQVQKVVNFEAKNPKIVPKQIKIILDHSISAVNDILWDLSHYENTAKKMDIAKAGVKRLVPILKSLKPSLADAFSKTTADLKKGMYDIVSALIGALTALQIKENFSTLKHLDRSLQDTSMLAKNSLE